MGWLILRDRNFVPWFWPENYFVKLGWNSLSFRLTRTHEWYSRIFLARNRKIYDCRCIQPHLALTRGGCASTQSIDAEQLKGLWSLTAQYHGRLKRYKYKLFENEQCTGCVLNASAWGNRDWTNAAIARFFHDQGVQRHKMTLPQYALVTPWKTCVSCWAWHGWPRSWNFLIAYIARRYWRLVVESNCQFGLFSCPCMLKLTGRRFRALVEVENRVVVVSMHCRGSISVVRALISKSTFWCVNTTDAGWLFIGARADTDRWLQFQSIAGAARRPVTLT
jgi:hypothetical protein